MDLVEFLTERIDEDEAVARGASPGPWIESGDGSRVTVWAESTQEHVHDDMDPLDRDHANADTRHIARHDPARVLREVEAKRAILALASQYVAPADTFDPGFNGGAGYVGWNALRHLAAIYADHEDFQEEWRV